MIYTVVDERPGFGLIQQCPWSRCEKKFSETVGALVDLDLSCGAGIGD